MDMLLDSVILTPFVCLQASVIAFLWLRGRHDKAFRHAFYIFFMTATIVDCLFIVLDQVELCIAYVTGRHLEDGWIYSGSSLTYVVEGFIQALKHITMIAMVYQPLIHMIIAINRLTAFAFPLRHSTMWSRRIVTVSTLGMATVAILFVGIPSVYIGVFFTGDPTSGNSLFDHTLRYAKAASCEALFSKAKRVASNRRGFKMTVILLYRTLLLITCSIAAFILNIMTVAMFILHRRSNKMSHSQRGQDVRLFVHSLFMLLVQAILSFQMFARMTNQIWKSNELGSPFPWVPKWLSLDSREWLAGDPHCTGTHYGDAVAETVGPVPGAKPCGTLYMILSGQQNLFIYTTVETMMHYLFSFSSGPFLLSISGTVRSGYLQFYFKRWQTMKKKVVQVTPASPATSSVNHQAMNRQMAGAELEK